MKAIRDWRVWLPTWLKWVLGTTLGYFLQWLVAAGLSLATFWDPDEVETYLRSPLVYLLVMVLYGAICGVALVALIGLIHWISKTRLTGRMILSAVATILATSLLCGLSAIGPGSVESDLMIGLRSGAVGGAIGGLFAGAWQWGILDRRVGRTGDWIALTAVGWMVVCSTSWAVLAQPVFESHILSKAISFAVVGAVGGLAGLGQWFVLRRKVPRAGWWILAASLSWAITYLISEFAGLGTLFAPGVIEGTALVLLLPEPAPDVKDV